MMVVTSPRPFRADPAGHPGDRAAYRRLRAERPPAVALCPGPPCRCFRLRRGGYRWGEDYSGLHAGEAGRRALLLAGGGCLRGRPERHAVAGAVDCLRHLLGLRQRGRRALARGALGAERRDERRHAGSVPSLLGLCGGRARRAQSGVGRGQRRRRGPRKGSAKFSPRSRRSRRRTFRSLCRSPRAAKSPSTTCTSTTKARARLSCAGLHST